MSASPPEARARGLSVAAVTDWIRTLHPGQFRLVMATGIVSIAAQLMGLSPVAWALFFVNVVAYALIWVATIVRALRHPGALAADVGTHGRAPGFMTWAASTAVLGSQMVVIAKSPGIATALLIVAGVLWLVATYTVIPALTVKPNKPALGEGITGGWLLLVVGTQAIPVLTGLLVAGWSPAIQERMLFAVLAMWLAGVMLYIWISALIFFRFMFFEFRPEDMGYPYWINMGAMAISVLAGAGLIGNAQGNPLLTSLLPFVQGLTVLLWAVAAWWIPVLVILTVWKHIHRPLRYDPMMYGAVFPLGMFTVATIKMTGALKIDFLGFIPNTFFWIALAAWAAVFVGMLASVVLKTAADSGSSE
ncbi:tellurite resistance/C4-dicarboxylate transporter family protein [Nocardioides sp. NPDC126508]